MPIVALGDKLQVGKWKVGVGKKLGAGVKSRLVAGLG